MVRKGARGAWGLGVYPQTPNAVCTRRAKLVGGNAPNAWGFTPNAPRPALNACKASIGGIGGII